jgi:CSLREA domain-containing protein
MKASLGFVFALIGLVCFGLFLHEKSFLDTNAPTTKTVTSMFSIAKTDSFNLSAASALAGPTLQTHIVTKLEDTNDGVCDVSDCSLREAISTAAAGDTISFAVTGTIMLGIANGELLIDKTLMINGPGFELLTVNGGGNSRLFRVVGSNTYAVISGMTLLNGMADEGGAIHNDHANLLIDRCVLEKNVTPSRGGAIFTKGNGRNAQGIITQGITTVSNSTLTGNQAQWGGAVANYSSKMVFLNRVSRKLRESRFVREVQNGLTRAYAANRNWRDHTSSV